MAIVNFIRVLFSSYADFLCIDHDDVIAGIEIRRILGIVFSTQAVCDFRCEPAEYFVGSVDNVPIAFNRIRGGGVGSHAGKSGRKKSGNGTD